MIRIVSSDVGCTTTASTVHNNFKAEVDEKVFQGFLTVVCSPVALLSTVSTLFS